MLPRLGESTATSKPITASPTGAFTSNVLPVSANACVDNKARVTVAVSFALRVVIFSVPWYYVRANVAHKFRKNGKRKLLFQAKKKTSYSVPF